MSIEELDIAIVGGGLAGGTLAMALRKHAPDLSCALFEAGDVYGGNHRWSWFEHDLDEDGAALLEPFARTAWTGGNEVRFPGYSRRLESNYRSLDSRDFDAGIRRALPQEAIRTGARVVGLDGAGITLGTGERIAARAVVDCRDALPSEHLAGGWQVFLGQHLKTTAQHGIKRPVIMDATVNQPGAYRFVYLLPLGPDEIFVEDTYYADSPELDAEILRQRIADYAAGKDWQFEIVHEETGVLPVITDGDFEAYRASLSTPGVTLAGARGGFVHPLTSYTVPIAVRNALAIARAASDDIAALPEFVDSRAKQHWRDTAYYRLLGKMLFQAAEPAERYRVFERFYRLPEVLISRFYAARSTLPDKLRILTGKPPVSVSRAIRALLGKGAPLVQGKSP